MRPASRRRLALAAPIAWMALIFALSSVPGHRKPSARQWDKLAHAAEYAILGWLGHRALREAGVRNGAAIAAAAAGAAAFGISDEWHQSFVPFRSVEAADAVADAVGGLLGASIAGWCGRRDGPVTSPDGAPEG